MKQNGFIASSLLYGMLALFLVIMLNTLAIFTNNKLAMDRLKEKALNETENDKTPASIRTIRNLLGRSFDINGIPDEISQNNKNGLYKDSSEENRYIYRGDSETNQSSQHPVINYICLDENTTGECSNQYLYRIISIETDGSIKVIKYNNSGGLIFDPGYKSQVGTENDIWKPKNSIVGTRYSNNSNDYCYSSDKTNYNGCNLWGSKSTIYPQINSFTPPSGPAYLNAYLNGDTYIGNGITRKETGVIEHLYEHEHSTNEKIKDSIVSHKFNIGSVSSSSTELNEAIQSEKATTWEGKIGLLNVTDYVNASANSECTSVNKYTIDANCYGNSKYNNWLYMNQNMWTITPDSQNHENQYYVKVSENGKLSSMGVKGTAYVYPVFYLKPNLKFTEATGDKNNPYRIKSN